MKTSWFKKYSLDWPTPFYVLLLAAFPVLFLYANNIAQMQFGQALSPLVICLVGAFLLWSLLTLLLRNGRKAGLATTLFLLFFFSYGRLYEALATWGVFVVPANVYLLPGVLLIWGYCVYFISRTKRDFITTTMVLNIVAVVLIIMNLANISIYEITKPQFSDRVPLNATDNVTSVIEDTQSLPDIYFIILDEYAHPDTIKDWAGYDNSQFIKNLEDKGFYIASKSRTRSPQTPQAIAQVLNMEYLTAGWDFDESRKEWREIISDNLVYPHNVPWSQENYKRYACNNVADFLKTKGYQYIYIGFGQSNERWNDYMPECADIYVNYFDDTNTIWVSEFQDILWNTTMLQPFNRYLNGNWYDNYYVNCMLNTFDYVKKLPDKKGPNFVFAHLIIPHGPLVFGENGEINDPLDYANYEDKRFYLGQYIFISNEIEEIVDEILKKSKIPPIIIIQSDHGLRPHNTGIVIDGSAWHKILNAQYLPGMDKAVLYDSISPVNTFRLIFNQYFHADYELLPDD